MVKERHQALTTCQSRPDQNGPCKTRGHLKQQNNPSVADESKKKGMTSILIVVRDQRMI